MSVREPKHYMFENKRPKLHDLIPVADLDHERQPTFPVHHRRFRSMPVV